MINNSRKKLRWITAILWMVFIFVMSQTPGDISSEQSQMVIKIFYLLGIDLNSMFGEIANFIVRKGAHFTEYLILDILIYRIFVMYNSKKRSIFYSVIGVFLYACTDELHQLFVEGRVAAFKDVLIDTLGGIVGSIIIKCMYKVKGK